MLSWKFNIKCNSKTRKQKKTVWTQRVGLSQKDGTSISVILKATKKTAHKHWNISIKL